MHFKWIHSLNVKTVLFQAIHFSISIQFCLIWPIDRTLSGAITPGWSGPRNEDNEGLVHIPQSSSITATSWSDCLVTYLGHSLRRILPLCRNAIGVFYNLSWLAKYVCVCVCVFVCIHVCIHVYIHVCVCVYTCVYTCIYMCVCVCIHMCVYMYIYMCVYTCIYTCIYTCVFYLKQFSLV